MALLLRTDAVAAAAATAAAVADGPNAVPVPIVAFELFADDLCGDIGVADDVVRPHVSSPSSDEPVRRTQCI